MRPWLVLIAVAVLASAAAGCGGASSGGEAATPRPALRAPSLRLAGDGSSDLRGTGFKPGEHVTVSVAGLREHRVVADGDGTFSVLAGGMNTNECSGLSASAAGDRGSRASFKRAPGQCALP